MSQVTSLRKRHRFNSRMIRIVLLISFLFFFGRFVYSAIGAWHHHQDKKNLSRSLSRNRHLLHKPTYIDRSRL
ncbi:YfgG family protein [Citrobacter portucalensis]|uniref:YfgG family protein n=1 Tax=Citrobacter portucalensis TaxID=1639133 RepID=UPI00351D02FD